MSEENGQGNSSENTSNDIESLESEARLTGWLPKDEFTGDEAKWVDAETFVQRGKEIAPILRKNNERLMRELGKRDREIQEMQLTLKEFSEMYKKMSETAYQRALTEVKGQLRAARENGDHELIEQLEEQRDSLVEESKNIRVPGDKPAPTTNPQGQAILTEWMGENKWYNSENNPDLYYAAEGYATNLAKQRPDLVGKREFLDEVTKQVKKMYPDRFKNKNRETGSPAGGGSSAGSSRPNGKKVYSDLPADAKAACDRFVKSIPGYTREQYVQQYFEQE